MGRWLAVIAQDRIARRQGFDQAVLGAGGAVPEREQGWREYATALLMFNVLGVIAVYALQRLQRALPLNPQGFAAVAAETPMNTLAREGSARAADARLITEQAHCTAQLVNNLLDMARLQAGAVTARRDCQLLEELAGRALRSVGSALGAHPVRIDLPDDLPLLHAAGVLIERVLANLFENVAKYTPAGSTITLSASREGPQIVIDVSDDGPGLPAGEVETLFRKFSRGDKESSTPGVGLGLAICRAIVQAHGGQINGFNRTVPEHGAVLQFTLPHREMTALDVADLPAQ